MHIFPVFQHPNKLGAGARRARDFKKPKQGKTCLQAAGGRAIYKVIMTDEYWRCLGGVGEYQHIKLSRVSNLIVLYLCELLAGTFGFHESFELGISRTGNLGITDVRDVRTCHSSVGEAPAATVVVYVEYLSIDHIIREPVCGTADAVEG